MYNIYRYDLFVSYHYQQLDVLLASYTQFTGIDSIYACAGTVLNEIIYLTPTSN